MLGPWDYYMSLLGGSEGGNNAAASQKFWNTARSKDMHRSENKTKASSENNGLKSGSILAA